MAKLYNLARMTTTTTGTGDITLGTAVSGYLSFADAGVLDGDVVSYGIKDGTDSEVGTGVYTSTDDGKTFKLVYDQHPYYSLAVTTQNPQLLYGKTGTNLYRSNDGGHSWTALPHLSGGTFSVLVVVPNTPSEIYASLSYPTELYRLNANDTSWTSLTPPAKQG